MSGRWALRQPHGRRCPPTGETNRWRADRSSTSRVIRACSWAAVGAPKPGPPASTPTTGRRRKGTPFAQLANHPSPSRGAVTAKDRRRAVEPPTSSGMPCCGSTLVPCRLMIAPRILTASLRRPTATPRRSSPRLRDAPGLMRTRAAYLYVRSAQRNRMRGHGRAGQRPCSLRPSANTKPTSRWSHNRARHPKEPADGQADLAVDRLRPVHQDSWSEEPSVESSRSPGERQAGEGSRI